MKPYSGAESQGQKPQRILKSERFGETESMPFFSRGLLVSKNPDGLFSLIKRGSATGHWYSYAKAGIVRSLHAIYTLCFHQNGRGRIFKILFFYRCESYRLVPPETTNIIDMFQVSVYVHAIMCVEISEQSNVLGWFAPSDLEVCI